MNAQTRTQSYPGTFRSQAEDSFRVDAADAARHGWFPVDQRWDGQALHVSYHFGQPVERWAAPAGAQPPSPAYGLPAPMPQEAPSTAMLPAAVIVLVAGLAGAAGSFLPWGTVSNGFVRLEQSGMNGGDGWLTLVLGAAIAIGGFTTLHGARGRTWITVLIGSVLLAGLAIFEIGDVTTKSVMSVINDGAIIQVGIGLYVILAAGVVAAIASFGLRRRRA
jgi:hypothetical protein